MIFNRPDSLSRYRITTGISFMLAKIRSNRLTGTSKQDATLSIVNDSAPNFEYYIMNSFATIVVCCGIVTGNTSLVIGGAMLAMLLGPILGVSLSLINHNSILLRTALFSETIGVILVLIISFIFAKLYDVNYSILLKNGLLHYVSPNILDLMIAIIGGTAGTYVTIVKRQGIGMIGVAMAITLVPPLSACGIFLAHLKFANASNAFFLFFTNFVGIQFASLMVLLFFGFTTQDDTFERKTMLARSFISTSLIILLTFILGYNLKQTLTKLHYEQEVRERITAELKQFKGAYLTEIEFQMGRSPKITAIIRTPVDLTPIQIATLDDHLPLYSQKRARLHVQTVKITELSKEIV